MSGGERSVTTWYLEQTSRGDLRDARPPDASCGIRILRAEVPSPAFSRFLYSEVGSDVEWTDRLPWTYGRWQGWLDRPGVETWVAYERGTPAGYIELDGAPGSGTGQDEEHLPDEAGSSPESTVEISYFGLLPSFRGRRIGGHLLTYGTARAWDMDLRWPERHPTTRVWVHTCSKDGPHALGNYQRRGFRLFRTDVSEEPAAYEGDAGTNGAGHTKM